LQIVPRNITLDLTLCGLQVEADELDEETVEDEAEILAVAAARGRRSAVVVPSSSQKRKQSLPDRRTHP